MRQVILQAPSRYIESHDWITSHGDDISISYLLQCGVFWHVVWTFSGLRTTKHLGIRPLSIDKLNSNSVPKSRTDSYGIATRRLSAVLKLLPYCGCNSKKLTDVRVSRGQLEDLTFKACME
jgi:hypothetical protein